MRLLASLGAAAVSVALLTVLPWYLVPLGWVALGTAMFCASSVVSSCALGTFVKSTWLNSLVGTILGLPLLLSFTSLRVCMHNATDHLLSAADSSMWWLSGFWAFHRSNFRTWVSKLAALNNILLYVFLVAFVSVLCYFTGLRGLGKYYLAPLVVFYLWHSVSIKVGRSLQITIAEDQQLSKIAAILRKQYELREITLPDVARIVSKASKLMHSKYSRSFKLFEKIVGWEQIVPSDLALESLEHFKMVDVATVKQAALRKLDETAEPVEVIETEAPAITRSWDTYYFDPTKVCPMRAPVLAFITNSICPFAGCEAHRHSLSGFIRHLLTLHCRCPPLHKDPCCRHVLFVWFVADHLCVVYFEPCSRHWNHRWISPLLGA